MTPTPEERAAALLGDKQQYIKSVYGDFMAMQSQSERYDKAISLIASALRQAEAEAYERAAQVADKRAHSIGDMGFESACAAAEIAQRIRALIPKEPA